MTAAVRRRRGAVHAGIFSLLDEATKSMARPDIDPELATYTLQDVIELIALHAELTHAGKKKRRRK